MKRLGRDNVNLPPKQGLKLKNQSRMIEQASVLVEFNQEVDVAVVAPLAPRGRPEDPDAVSTVPLSNLEDCPSLGL